MSKVWKYQMPRPGRPTKMKIPACAKPLAVQVQGDDIVLWAEVNPRLSTVDVVFRTIGTDHEVPSGFRHLGTVQQAGMVWHVYANGIGDGHG